MSNDEATCEETENHFEKEYVDEDSLNVNNEIDQFVSQENAIITTDTFVIIKLTNKKITKNCRLCQGSNCSSYIYGSFPKKTRVFQDGRLLFLPPNQR